MNDYLWDNMKPGLAESFNVTITEEMMNSFRTITGDINPLHNDESFAKENGYEGKVCYGMLTASMLSTLAGVYLPGKRSLIHGVDIMFTKPVMIGDILNVKGTVYEVNEVFNQITLKVEIINQDNIKVLRGKMKVGVLYE